MKTFKFQAKKQHIATLAALWESEQQLQEEINAIDPDEGVYGIEVPCGVSREFCEADIESLLVRYGIFNGIHYDFI